MPGFANVCQRNGISPIHQIWSFTNEPFLMKKENYTNAWNPKETQKECIVLNIYVDYKAKLNLKRKQYYFTEIKVVRECLISGSV